VSTTPAPWTSTLEPNATIPRPAAVMVAGSQTRTAVVVRLPGAMPGVHSSRAASASRRTAVPRPGACSFASVADARPRVLFLVHQDDVRSGVFAEAAATTGWEAEERSFAPVAPRPESIDNYAAIVVFGGEMNVDEEDEHPWLREEKRYLADALDGGGPVLGVCLGAQLVASIAGGEVRRADKPEVGWHEVVLEGPAAEDPLLGGLPERFTALEWHFRELELPPGGVPLARNESCLQAYRLGHSAWGVQFHAEVTKETVATWAARYEHEPGDAHIDLAELHAQTERNIKRWNELGRSLCTRFLARAAG
jgi:GMP synthase-like glutamine amidotransferase